MSLPGENWLQHRATLPEDLQRFDAASSKDVSLPRLPSARAQSCAPTSSTDCSISVQSLDYTLFAVPGHCIGAGTWDGSQLQLGE